MIKLKKISSLLPLFTLLLFCAASTTVTAQEETEDKKKVVIITKKIDKDGKETVDKKVITGEDAEVYIIKEHDGDDAEHEDMNVEVEVEADEDGETKHIIKIRKQKEGGEDEVIEIDGDGTIMKIIDKDGNQTISIDNSDGDHNVEVEKTVEIKDGVKTETTIKRTYIGNSNKAYLGVALEKTDDKGVLVDKVMDNSPAQTAGLKKGDIITKINKTSVSSISDLTKALAPFKAGDAITVTYLRDGKSITSDTILKANSHNKSNNVWKTEDGEEIDLNGKKYKYKKKEKE